MSNCSRATAPRRRSFNKSLRRTASFAFLPNFRRNRILKTLWLGATFIVTAFATMGPNAAASSTLTPLGVADYAYMTASHANPAHDVLAPDLTNAVATKIVANSPLSLASNIGAIPDYSRIAIFVNKSAYSVICVDFPVAILNRPKVTPCPDGAIGNWQLAPSVLMISRASVALAASEGQAVSGPEVSGAFSQSRFTLTTRPRFKSGAGGAINVVGRVQIHSTNGSKVTIIHVCVTFPKTQAGIVKQTRC